MNPSAPMEAGGPGDPGEPEMGSGIYRYIDVHIYIYIIYIYMSG